MIIINEIIELARSMEPGNSKFEPSFKLTRDGGKDKSPGQWSAVVSMHTYWIDGTGSTAEEAMQALHEQLVQLNRSAQESILRRLANLITGKKPKLRPVGVA